MLRTSSYTIYVDLPGNAQDMLLVHGYTGAYDKVSRKVATFLRSLEPSRPPKPLYGDWKTEPDSGSPASPPSEQTLDILMRRGYLTKMSREEEEETFSRFVQKLHEGKSRRTPEYIFMPTYDCNLRCAYCFQDHMRTESRYRHLLRTMSKDVIDRIFTALAEIEEMHGLVKGESYHRNAGFFGGEPLLETSRPAVEAIIKRFSAIGPTNFWAVTNGTELQAYEDLLGPHAISSLQITFDGPPDEHDKRRIYADGQGSYQRIAKNVTMALDRGARVSVRLNLDRLNIGDLPDLVEDFGLRGWSGHSGFSVYAAIIRPENDKTDASSTFSSTWELDKALVNLQAQDSKLKIINRPDDKIKFTARKIFEQSEEWAPSFMESFCSAHTRMYIFDAFADIYACWERTGDPAIRIGTIDLEGKPMINMPVSTLWRSRTVASNPVCRQCRYALQCGGGCAVLAAGSTGEYHSNFCDGFASRFRAAVAEAYIENINGVEAQNSNERVCDQ